MKKLRLLLWTQLLLLPLIVFSSFSGCEGEEEEIFVDNPEVNDSIPLDKPEVEDSVQMPEPEVKDTIPLLPQAGYYLIPEEQLDGWDEGIITSDKHYFVIKADTAINGYVCYMNDSVNSNMGLAAYLDEKFNVTKMIFDEGVLSVEYNYTEKNAYVSFIDSKGNLLSDKLVELTDGTLSRNGLFTRSGENLILSGADGLIKGYGYLDNLGTLGNLVSGDWGTAFNGLAVDVAAGTMGGIVAGLPGAIAGVVIGELFNTLKKQGEKYDKMGEDIRLGSSTAQIIETKRTGIYTYQVKVGVTGLASRNPKLGVKVGLFMRENFSTVNDKYQTDATEMISIGNDGTVTFTVEVEKANGIYYIVPVLLPYRQFSNGAYTEMRGYIRYGDVARMEGDVFEIHNIKPGKCAVSNNYKFNVEVSASMLCPDDVSSWGVDLYVWRLTASMSEVNSKKVGTIDYPVSSSTYTLKYEGQLQETYFDKDNKLFNMRAVPFAITDKGERVEGEPYTFVIDASDGLCPDGNHPHLIDLGLPSGTKWACCNVGASSPEGYGGYYAWGETEEKSDYTYKTYKYWSDRDGDGYGDGNEYHNIGSNISGTQYDVAHVKWGGNWRMPTKEEIRELVNKCSWKWTSLNGVNGQLVTGPNGNSIFLPAAGIRGGTDLYFRGSYGHYWSATLSESNSYSAYDLYFGSGYSYWDYNWGLYDGRTVRPVTE